MIVALLLAASLGCGSHPEYRLDPVFGVAATRATRGSIQASRHIAFRLEVPRGGSDAHAQGAYKLAHDAARNFSGTISAAGVSRAAASAALRLAAARFVQNANAQLQLELRTYDRVTEFGHAQDQGPAFGFPGGLNC
ncbi:MAG: hypothetical protein M3Y18_02015 [Candidatus Eremiobacteraeota bacterium]|nr:hypothetical protein [Candidatus Eremiobacteraeota bacterium]